KLAGKTLLEISEAKLVTQDGLVIAEHSSKEILEESYGSLKIDDQRTYGQTLVSFFSLLV
ncbi:MAG TPA: 16S rRNA (guanine(966)-N(2))-methyltransferase RsmD, partial [Thermodesulfobacteriota bacterium]|nr:16S rRNA (guanine(966)-N(2))-methyltransferase RsmD [Thermodesulfobacteriota bacterium]